MIYVATIEPVLESERVVDASSDLNRLLARLENDHPYGALARVGIEKLDVQYDANVRTWWQIGEDGTLRITKYDD